MEGGERDRPYDTPLPGGLVPRAGAGRAPARQGASAAARMGGETPAGAESAAQAGVPADRAADHEGVPEALWVCTSQARPHAYQVPRPLGPAAAGSAGPG